MKLLVVGDSPTAHKMVEMLRQPVSVSHVRCADALRAELEQSGDYGFVLVDDSECGEAHVVSMIVKEVMPDASLSRISPHQTASELPRRPMPMCAVETNRDGMQILRCALRHAARDPDGDPALRAAIGERPLVFEYHAARRKTG